MRAGASVRYKSQNKKVSITVILFKQKPATLAQKIKAKPRGYSTIAQVPVQETALNVPLVEQVAVPLPEYPALQVTTTSCPVVPKIELAAA